MFVDKKNNLFGEENHVFIIAEAGSNWKMGTNEEDIERATKLIEIASKAGANAVKFQTFQSESIYVQNAGNINYLKRKMSESSINEIFEKLSMPYEMIPKLAAICEKNNIMFMSTPFSVKDAKMIDPYVKIHKVSSFENNHIRLLEFLAYSKKPVIISTGATELTEIEFLVNFWKENGGGPLCLLQCTSKYPAPLNSLNISAVNELKKYNVYVGLSDHSEDPIIAPLVAIGMGARVIEKHFTLDKNLVGPDHSFSLNPSELEQMIKALRKAEKTIGKGQKIVNDEEIELRNFAKRSIQAIRDISKGEILKEGINFEVLRPGSRSRGANPTLLTEINGKKAKSNIMVGDGIKLEDCE